MAANFDLSVVQGDTLKWSMYFTGPGGTAYNLAGCTLSMQLRKGYYPSTLVSTYKVYIPSGSSNAGFPEGIIGGLSAAATGGTVYICLGSTYTAQCSYEALAKYDIQLYTPVENDTTTIIRGSITVIPEVTRQ